MRIVWIVVLLFGFGAPVLATEFSSSAALNQISIQNRDWVFGNLEAGFAGRTVSTRLLLWSLPWMGASVIGLSLTNDPAAKGWWMMNGVWGFINSAIAMVGLLTPEPSLETMRNLLLINAGIDVLYIAGGVFLLTRPEPMWQGAGWGVILQGTFLLVFDLWQGLAIRF
ncbi:MAG: DUF6992 family protein [Deinococcales bacterium]